MPPETAEPGLSSLVPPGEMLYDGSSTPEEFVSFGDNFCEQILLQRAHLPVSATMLDLGCGNGAIARALTRVLSPAGRYEGLDISRTSVAWLQDRYRPYPNFRFTHADVFNTWYNPAGRCEAGTYRLPFDDGVFDFVLLKSVFTHMLPEDVRHYLQEIARVLKPGGRALLTYFLLNIESRRLIDLGLDKVSLRNEYQGDAGCRIAKPEVPEWGVAHDEGRIRGYHADAGLSLLDISYGDWCGRPSSLGLQDLMIVMKDSSTQTASSSRETPPAVVETSWRRMLARWLNRAAMSVLPPGSRG